MSQTSAEIPSDLYPSRRSDTADMLPRADPIVYGGSSAAPPFNERQRGKYERDGFVVLGDLFDAAELAALGAELQRLKAAAPNLREHGVIVEPGGTALRSIFRVHKHSRLLSRLARDARLVRRAEYLLGSPVYVHQSRLNYKPGFHGREFYWHSDFETWHVEDGMPRMRALSISISLSNNTEYNGPLMLIPGSHRVYVACAGETPENHYRQSLRRQEYGVPEPDQLAELFERGGIETVTGPAGTTVCFDCNTMHGSNGNITPLPRANIFIVYNSIENKLRAPFGAPEARPTFLAERERFEPIEAFEGKLTTDTDAST